MRHVDLQRLKTVVKCDYQGSPLDRILQLLLDGGKTWLEISATTKMAICTCKLKVKPVKAGLVLTPSPTPYGLGVISLCPEFRDMVYVNNQKPINRASLEETQDFCSDYRHLVIEYRDYVLASRRTGGIGRLSLLIPVVLTQRPMKIKEMMNMLNDTKHFCRIRRTIVELRRRFALIKMDKQTREYSLTAGRRIILPFAWVRFPSQFRHNTLRLHPKLEEWIFSIYRPDVKPVHERSSVKYDDTPTD